MTDKEYKATKVRIQKMLKKWRPAGFGWFHISYSYEREHDENPRLAAKCDVDWQYKSAHITFFAPVMSELDDERLENTVVHELCHVLISPIQDFSDENTRQMTEYTTSLVADSLIWASKFVK